MHRLTGEDSIFNSPEDMIESILYICKNYEVYNISAKLISRAYTGWHQYPEVKNENGYLYMNSATGNIQSYLPLELLEEITIRYREENEYYKAKYEDTLRVTTKYLDKFLKDDALDILIRYENK
ncbi:hypothetical protein [Inconstantimicrobium porci]|uniref:Uncharacterized protein n=1 Tax=Inconstantimicrobium porci TaxID=2652291 RepID=A0A7X2T196_9CLOT|nr:hypothetical protein [Inconstantimicrobium porci]MSR91364.1 hypothetical protein [Inconstantimicrobium porci]